MRGQFSTPEESGEPAVEWCERRLLARIHRYTIKRLRSEIEPVSPASFMRFLFSWQGLTDKPRGPDALAAVVEQLEGFSAAAGSWEKDILPSRLDLYTGDMLDSLCATGKSAWLRLNVRRPGNEKRTSPVRNAPVALIDRLAVPYWRTLCPLPDRSDIPLSGIATAVVEALQQHGASFFVDLVQSTGMLRTQVEEALGELVNWGMVTSDSFAGLRALVRPASQRPGFGIRRRSRRRTGSGFDQAGRWALVRSADDVNHSHTIEHIAWVLLRRYGVVFRKVLERESNLPPWRDLIRVYWRMEARGEIRGGRFVQGFSGQQFALPDAIAALRSVRNSKPSNDRIAVSAADPLNLVGIIVPGDKIAATLNNRILFLDGVPVAYQSGNHFHPIGSAELDIESRTALMQQSRPGSVLPVPQRRI